jgi:two-component system, chemotaxis family, CheB/CheR fusion protein
VKNTLTVVQAIAHQTLRYTKSNKDFVERFDGRLAALGAAHGLLVESDWKGADLGALVRQQLQPYVSEKPDRLNIEGPNVLLTADLATPFGLVLHELATNAAKYGALSRAKGTVALNWTVTGNKKKTLKLIWKERGGPAVKQPKGAGFGRALIEQGIPGASVSHEFRSDGVVCTIELPLPEADNGIAK